MHPLIIPTTSDWCYTIKVNLLSFASLVAWVTSHSYPLILVGMFVEGPIITTAAGFAAGLGLLNVFVLWLLSIVGDFLGDTVYYYVGYWQRNSLKKHGHHFGLTEKRLERFEKLFAESPWQALAIIKTGPVLTGGLLLAGATRMPYRKYILLGITITALKNIPLLALGYLAGAGHAAAARSLHYGEYIIFGGLLLLILITYLVSRATIAFSRRLEKSHQSQYHTPGV